MSKELTLHLVKITQVKTYDGEIIKVILKEDEYDETDITIKLSLNFKRAIPSSWKEVIGRGDFGDTVRMVLSAKSQQTHLE
jgi:hypothetical protein